MTTKDCAMTPPRNGRRCGRLAIFLVDPYDLQFYSCSICLDIAIVEASIKQRTQVIRVQNLQMI